MGVVIEGAPAETAGILGIRSQLIVHAGMAERLFSEPFGVVSALGRISVPDKLSVQIQGMVRGTKGKTEIVNREHVFEKLG